MQVIEKCKSIIRLLCRWWYCTVSQFHSPASRCIHTAPVGNDKRCYARGKEDNERFRQRWL